MDANIISVRVLQSRVVFSINYVNVTLMMKCHVGARAECFKHLVVFRLGSASNQVLGLVSDYRLHEVTIENYSTALRHGECAVVWSETTVPTEEDLKGHAYRLRNVLNLAEGLMRPDPIASRIR